MNREQISSRVAPDSMGEEANRLMQLDRDFDRQTARRGAEAWVSFFAEHGAMGQNDAPPLSGHESIRAAMSPLLDNPDAHLRWNPTHAEIWVTGEIGYTRGRYERKTLSADGKPSVSKGTYITIWKMQQSGEWKILYDTGIPDKD